MKLSSPIKGKDFVGTSLKRIFGSYQKRIPLKGEAAPPTNDLWARPTYVPGDLGRASVRAGAMDAYAIPSRGNRT